MEVRKRKREFNFTFSTKYLLLSLCIFFLIILFYRGFISEPFQPTHITPNLAILSLSVSNSLQDQTTDRRTVNGIDFGIKNPAEFRVVNRVVFTDHVLVILTTNETTPHQQRIDCVYQTELNNVSYPMLSADVYSDDRWIIRCPTPPTNYTLAVGLRGYRDDVSGFDWVAGLRVGNEKQTVHKWDMLAYDAVFDGNYTVAVFVKGLHLKAGRESDSSYFSCHFESSYLSDDGLTVNAITASQEVIRCPVPKHVKDSLRGNEDVIVTVKRNKVKTLLPSIARLSRNSLRESKNSYKYELCGCSMVWNQAGFTKEWIAYHAWLGVQRWFLYDNNSDDGLKEVIDELDSENFNVSRVVWPWVKSQEAGFSHCVLRARDECRWVGFFDVDEFFYFPPPRHKDMMVGDPARGSLKGVVENVTSSSKNRDMMVGDEPDRGSLKGVVYNVTLSSKNRDMKVGDEPARGSLKGFVENVTLSSRNRDVMVGDEPGRGSLRRVVDNVTLSLPLVGEIRTNCYTFGPSELKQRPKEGVTLGYTCRMRNSERHKSIIRPDAVDDTLLNQVHHFKLKKDFIQITLPQSKAVINHYKYQVWDVFKAKFHRRVSTYVADWQEKQNENSRDRAPGLGTEVIEPLDWHKRFCEVWDTRLRDLILAKLGDPHTGLVQWRSF